MRAYIIDSYYKNIADRVVILLRREGYGAYLETDSLYTNAPRAIVLLAAGNGLFIA